MEMEPDCGEFLAGKRVAIVGLGLMGGSLALALGGCGAELIGFDPDPETVALALERGIIASGATDPAEGLAQADLILLAAPVRAILNILADLPALHPGAPVVLDLGSTKGEIVAHMGRLPERFAAVGGHPMCGKERAGLAHAEAGLFQGAPFALVPTRRTTPAAHKLAVQLAEFVGAVPLWLDAATHDRWVAATSHVPYLLACALATATPTDAAPLVGPGFRSSTRLAAASQVMMLDILLSNRENIVDGLDRLQGGLDALRALVSQGDERALAEALVEAQRQHRLLSSGCCPAPETSKHPEG